MPTKLEELGEEFRKENIIKNAYQNSDGKGYGPTHPNALSDGDNKGKGTSSTSDSIDTVNGGGDMDINGNPEVPKSGRNALVGMNESQSGIVGPNGFGPAKPYYPDYIISADQ